MIDYKGVDFSKILKRYDVEAQNETTPEAVAKKMLPADPVLKNVAECVLYMKFKDVVQGRRTGHLRGSEDPQASGHYQQRTGCRNGVRCQAVR